MKYKILLVEDSKADAEQLTLACQQGGFQTSLADSGEKALEMVCNGDGCICSIAHTWLDHVADTKHGLDTDQTQRMGQCHHAFAVNFLKNDDAKPILF